MYAVASMNTKNIQDLANLTDATKKEYCQRHGYKFFVMREEDFVVITDPFSNYMDFNKPFFILNLFNQNPDIEWLLMSECDATITNLNVKLEDKIDNDFHLVIPVDCKNLNSGNFLIRNSEQGRNYLQKMIDRHPEYAESQGPNSTWTDKWGIQQYIIDTIEEFAEIIKIVPQKYMNSYEPEIYDYFDVTTDILGTSGVWEKGDWIIHWPGIKNNVRVERAKRLLENDLIAR